MNQPTSRINPATLISLWLVLAVAIQWLSLSALAALTLGTMLALAATRATGAWRMLRRARWLLLSLMLIYSFATPGDSAFPALGAISPTLQGLRGGGLQAWRLALLLATLALLMRACPRETLLAGIYLLMRPFRALAIDPERIAVRLWLTLHYAEEQPRRDLAAWWRELRTDIHDEDKPLERISLHLPRFTWRDLAALTIACILLGAALW